MTKKTAIKEIKELDDSIDLLRDNWMNCSEKNKPRCMNVIDRLLDERLILMAERDKKVEPKKSSKQSNKC